ncbi:hypothetical protein K438DRAFT_1053392 [Mycena galopus ATCC 62051]|nr:hypothetical protein K438DRAFT_1053392 [Mycena galopus ATCC 62051]
MLLVHLPKVPENLGPFTPHLASIVSGAAGNESARERSDAVPVHQKHSRRCLSFFFMNDNLRTATQQTCRMRDCR